MEKYLGKKNIDQTEIKRKKSKKKKISTSKLKLKMKLMLIEEKLYFNKKI